MFKIELLDWPAAEQQASRIRFTVFVEEQRVPAELEMDENDAASLHALAYADGRAIGTGRLLPDGHICRMAVLKGWGGAGGGKGRRRASGVSATSRSPRRSRQWSSTERRASRRKARSTRRRASRTRRCGCAY